MNPQCKRASLALLLTCIMLWSPLAISAQTNTNITPVVTLLPATFPIQETCYTVISITNGNPASAKSLQSGQAFKITFDFITNLQIESLVLVNSTTFTPADFGLAAGSASNQVTITYLGASKLFKPGDSFG